MGHVHTELRSEGRGLHEWDYLPFSEPRIVAFLIRNRMRLDETYSEKCFPSGETETCGGMLFSEPVLATYVVLDSLIHRARLSRAQKCVVNLLMRGWNLQDIADEFGYTKQYISKEFQNAIRKIERVNQKDQDRHMDMLRNTA